MSDNNQEPEKGYAEEWSNEKLIEHAEWQMKIFQANDTVVCQELLQRFKAMLALRAARPIDLNKVST